MYLQDAWSSLTVFCNDTIAELKSNGVSSDLSYIDWDAHANLQELPRNDLLGPNGLAVTELEEAFQFVFILGVATHADANLFRLRAIVDRLFTSVRFGRTLPLYDWKAGTVRGSMVIQTGTTIMPMSRSENHAVQYIQAEALALRTEVA